MLEYGVKNLVYGIKVVNMKKGKRYGPYPREDDLWYLYEGFREGGRIRKRFLGKGPLPKRAKGVTQETGSDIPRQGEVPSQSTGKKSPFELMAEYLKLMAEVSRRYRKGYYNSYERELVCRSLQMRYTAWIGKAFDELPESSFERPAKPAFILTVNNIFLDVMKVTQDFDDKGLVEAS